MSLVAAAKPVSPRNASDVAGVFFPNTDLSIQEIGDMYLFTPVSGNGFVLVAADDCVRPVLAWSPTGTFPLDNMPVHVRSWIDGYQREVEAFAAIGFQSRKVADEWDMYLNGRPKTLTAVEPLVTTVWSQGNPFNTMCPYDETDSAYSVVGCVATAMAQVMKYWNHPAVGWGSHGYFHGSYGWLSAQFDTTHYRWSMMPDTLTVLNSPEEISAVAELSYHAGVAVNMNYSPRSSGAYVSSYGYVDYPSAENALKTYFKYNPMLYSVFKSEKTDHDWDSLMRREIDAARPVLYSGHDSVGGHAFVLDGYDSLGMFHVNWGWGGSYNGYYTIDSLSPGAGGIGGNATYTFNMNNCALIDVYPAVIDSSVSQVTVNLACKPQSMGSITGNGTYEPYSQVNILAQATPFNRFVRWASGSNSNPLSFLASCDVTDTAIFERVGGDTLGYCFDAQRSSWRDDYGDVTEWGIRIPVEIRNVGRNLVAIQMYVYENSGQFSLNIYRGDSINGDTPFYSQSFTPEGYGWQIIPLDSALFINNYQTIWVTVRYQGDGFPAAFCRYVGNTDGSWYHLPQGWRRYDQLGEFMTWQLRAVFEPRTIMVDVRAADENVCAVYGGGSYLGGDDVTVGAIVLDPRCQFLRWNNDITANPFSFTAMDDIVLTAHCSCDGVGIGDVESGEWVTESVGLRLESSREAELFDMQGRLLGHGTTFEAPAAGVYILRANGAIKKVVLCR